MKLSRLFPVLALALFPLAARATELPPHSTVATTAHAPAGKSQLPGSLVTGTGYGVLTTPGMFDGSVLAQLRDDSGARRYSLSGAIVHQYTCCGGQDPSLLQGAFHGELIAPGELIAVEGTWIVSATGVGQFGAVIEADDGRKIGQIEGVFELPQAPPTDVLDLALLQRRSIVLRRRALIEQHPLARHSALGAQLHELDADGFVDPGLYGIEAPLSLVWSKVE
jgi:hypothetical protein